MRYACCMLILGRPPQALPQGADKQQELQHVGAIDMSVLNDAEQAEVWWVEETLSKKGASQEDLLEAHRLLEQYKSVSKERAQGS